MNFPRTIVVSAFLAAWLFPARALAQRSFLKRSVAVAGKTYLYRVYVPADWDAGRKWPVILFLHGVGERGSDGVRQTTVGLPRVLRKRAVEAVVVMPQCRDGKTWNFPDMQAQALKALERSVREFRGDEDRLYATGLSMGGYGTWQLAAARPGLFAAYVVVSGGVRAPKAYPDIKLSLVDDPGVADPYAALASRVGATPAWLFHGGADPVVPVEEARRVYAALKPRDPGARYTEYPGVGHDAWDKAYAEPTLFSWLLAQRRRAAAARAE